MRPGPADGQYTEGTRNGEKAHSYPSVFHPWLKLARTHFTPALAAASGSIRLRAEAASSRTAWSLSDNVSKSIGTAAPAFVSNRPRAHNIELRSTGSLPGKSFINAGTASPGSACNWPNARTAFRWTLL